MGHPDTQIRPTVIDQLKSSVSRRKATASQSEQKNTNSSKFFWHKVKLNDNKSEGKKGEKLALHCAAIPKCEEGTIYWLIFV
jgi:hypothetical protein